MKKYISLIKLAVLLVLVPAVIYFLSLSDTVKLCKEYRKARESAGKVVNLGRIDDSPASAPLLSGGGLMSLISDVCAANNVQVGHYSPRESGCEGTLHLVSARLDLTGSFSSLLTVLDRIEDVREIRISGAEFRTVKVGRDGRSLQLELNLLQVEDLRL